MIYTYSWQSHIMTTSSNNFLAAPILQHFHVFLFSLAFYKIQLFCYHISSHEFLHILPISTLNILILVLLYVRNKLYLQIYEQMELSQHKKIFSFHLAGNVIADKLFKQFYFFKFLFFFQFFHYR